MATAELDPKGLCHTTEDVVAKYPKALIDAMNDSQSRIAQEIGKGTHLRTNVFEDGGIKVVYVVKPLAAHQHAQYIDASGEQAMFSIRTAANWTAEHLVWPPLADPMTVDLMTQIPMLRLHILRSAAEVCTAFSSELKKRLLAWLQ